MVSARKKSFPLFHKMCIRDRSKVNTQFKNYGQYIFNNPATEFTTVKNDVFDGMLDAEGKANFRLKLPAEMCIRDR